jgi:hypothetical protein
MVGDEALDTLTFVTNTYIKDINRPSHKRRLYMKCLDDKTDAYNRFAEELTWSPYYIGMYNIDDDFDMVVMEIPDIHWDDYDLLLAGKYSQISELYKEMIISYHDLTDHSFAYGALYRKEFAYKIIEARINKGLKKQHWTLIPREQEIGSMINMELETFTEIVNSNLELNGRGDI